MFRLEKSTLTLSSMFTIRIRTENDKENHEVFDNSWVSNADDTEEAADENEGPANGSKEFRVANESNFKDCLLRHIPFMLVK